MPTARLDVSVVVDAVGRIHVMGGRASAVGGQVATHDVYDPVSETWSNAAPLPNHISGAGVALRGNGRIYVFGGYTGGGDAGRIAEVYVYDVGSDTWASLPNMPFRAWAAHGDFGTDDRLYVFGGQLAESRLQIFDPTLNTWTAGANLPAPRDVHGAFRGSDGRFYVFGG